MFPHSEIRGSMLICSSPQLIAASHVLRRLPMPRHSPYALLCLNYLFKSDLRSFLKLFSRLLELLCLRTFFFFTVTLANCLLAFASLISSDEILVFCYLLLFRKNLIYFNSNFPYFSLSCTLIRFSMSIQALSFVRLYNYLNSFKSL